MVVGWVTAWCGEGAGRGLATWRSEERRGVGWARPGTVRRLDRMGQWSGGGLGVLG